MCVCVCVCVCVCGVHGCFVFLKDSVRSLGPHFWILDDMVSEECVSVL